MSVPEDGAEVAFEDFARLGPKHLVGLAQVLLGRRRHVLHGGADLDDGHAVGHDGHALGRVDLGRRHVELVRKQREVLPLLHDGDDEGAAAADDLDAAAALVGEDVLAARARRR